MLLDLDRRSVDLGTAAHEMIHQLAVDSGLVPRHDMFPVWLHEGLGVAIRSHPRRSLGRHQPCTRPETTRLAAPAKPAPPGTPGPRRRLWPGLSARPLRPGLGFGLFPAHPETRSIPHLHRPVAQPRPRGRKYQVWPLATASSTPFSVPSAPTWTGLDDEWHKFMKTVQTPLEQHAEPGAASLKSKPCRRTRARY